MKKDAFEPFGIRKPVWIGALTILAGSIGLLIICSTPRRWRSADPRLGPPDRSRSEPLNFSINSADIRSPSDGLELCTLPTEIDFSQAVASLSDPVVEVRANAINELSLLGFGALNAVPILNNLALADPDEDVRMRAREAVYSIRGFSPSHNGGLD